MLKRKEMLDILINLKKTQILRRKGNNSKISDKNYWKKTKAKLTLSKLEKKTLLKQ